ncbi:MAG: hypothetical protein QM652_13155 [Legionella sp.]|uniref:hypothetical protein n=1 Tax=Legionella sp. TaxID=459 RepID=UPI0039E502A4
MPNENQEINSYASSMELPSISQYSSSDEVQANPIYTLPQALIKRRTKRLFNKEAIENSKFIAGLESAISHIMPSLTGYQLYFIVYNIEKIKPGIHSYHKVKKLVLEKDGIYSEAMSKNIQGLRTTKTAGFSIVIVADFLELMKKMPYEKGL